MAKIRTKGLDVRSCRSKARHDTDTLRMDVVAIPVCEMELGPMDYMKYPWMGDASSVSFFVNWRGELAYRFNPRKTETEKDYCIRFGANTDIVEQRLESSSCNGCHRRGRGQHSERNYPFGTKCCFLCDFSISGDMVTDIAVLLAGWSPISSRRLYGGLSQYPESINAVEMLTSAFRNLYHEQFTRALLILAKRAFSFMKDNPDRLIVTAGEHRLIENVHTAMDNLDIHIQELKEAQHYILNNPITNIVCARNMVTITHAAMKTDIVNELQYIAKEELEDAS